MGSLTSSRKNSTSGAAPSTQTRPDGEDESSRRPNGCAKKAWTVPQLMERLDALESRVNEAREREREREMELDEFLQVSQPKHAKEHIAQQLVELEQQLRRSENQAHDRLQILENQALACAVAQDEIEKRLAEHEEFFEQPSSSFQATMQNLQGASEAALVLVDGRVPNTAPLRAQPAVSSSGLLFDSTSPQPCQKALALISHLAASPLSLAMQEEVALHDQEVPAQSPPPRPRSNSLVGSGTRRETQAVVAGTPGKPSIQVRADTLSMGSPGVPDDAAGTQSAPANGAAIDTSLQCLSKLSPRAMEHVRSCSVVPLME